MTRMNIWYIICLQYKQFKSVNYYYFFFLFCIVSSPEFKWETFCVPAESFTYLASHIFVTGIVRCSAIEIGSYIHFPIEFNETTCYLFSWYYHCFGCIQYKYYFIIEKMKKHFFFLFLLRSNALTTVLTKELIRAKRQHQMYTQKTNSNASIY